MGQKGFIASSLLYGMLAIFLTIMLSMLAIFASNKLSIDRLKKQALDDINNYNIKPSKQTLNKLGIANEVVEKSTDPGIHKDPEVPNRYVYKGLDISVNNYLCLDAKTSGACSNDDLYRIISIESDGTMKVIKYYNIGLLPFDFSYKDEVKNYKVANTITGTRYSSTAGDYCYFADSTKYNGCNLWSNSTNFGGGIATSTLPTYDSYLKVYLNGGTYGGNGKTKTETGILAAQNDVIKNNLVSHAFDVGSVSSTSTGSLDDNITDYTWNGLLGLISAADYVKASTKTACLNIDNFLTDSECNNWLHLINTNGEYNNIWTLTADSSNNAKVYYIKGTDSTLTSAYVRASAAVHPVFYIKYGLEYTGSGTSSDAYRIKSN